MSIEAIGGSSAAIQSQDAGNDPYALAQASQTQQGQDAAPMDKVTFGAAVVATTLDYLNGQGSSGADAAPVDKQTTEAAVVAKTLDYLNAGQGQDNGMAQSYDFQKSVLGGHADAIGAVADIKV